MSGRSVLGERGCWLAKTSKGLVGKEVSIQTGMECKKGKVRESETVATYKKTYDALGWI